MSAVPGQRIDPDVRRAAYEQLLLGFSPRAVLRDLRADRRFADRIPSLRTLASMKAALRPSDVGLTWTVAEADPADAVLVLPVLAELIAVGNMTSVTRLTGSWIARLRRIAPAMPTIDVLVFASRYQAAASAGDSTHLIDIDLARYLR